MQKFQPIFEELLLEVLGLAMFLFVAMLGIVTIIVLYSAFTVGLGAEPKTLLKLMTFGVMLMSIFISCSKSR